MATRTTTADGDLLQQLQGDALNAYKTRQGGRPTVGGSARVWRLPGVWHVWSPGPESGTWWLQPRDDAARRTVAALAAQPSRGAPTVVAVAQGCIAVRSREIR